MPVNRKGTVFDRRKFRERASSRLYTRSQAYGRFLITVVAAGGRSSWVYACHRACSRSACAPVRRASRRTGHLPVARDSWNTRAKTVVASWEPPLAPTPPCHYRRRLYVDEDVISAAICPMGIPRKIGRKKETRNERTGHEGNSFTR